MISVICLLIICITIIGAQESPTYFISAPNTIRPHSDYHVSVTVCPVSSEKPLYLHLEISGPDKTDRFHNITSRLILNSCDIRIINFDIGGWDKGNYKLVAVGEGLINFKNESKLNYEQKSYSVFIQTDKAIYKPGQRVMFRAIIVTPSLHKAPVGSNNVYITDAHNNRIKQWSRVLPTRGVLSFDLLLSDKPPLGTWAVNVEINNQTFRKSFLVDEYILPTFSVDINLPPYTTYNRSIINVNIKATYTYGKPVSGNLTLTIQQKSRYYISFLRPLEQYHISTHVNGSVDLKIDLIKEVGLQMNQYYDRDVEFSAIVTEDLTGRRYNTSAILKIYEKDINIELISDLTSYRPGLPLELVFKAVYRDNTPVENSDDNVTIIYNYNKFSNPYSNKIITRPQNGLIKIAIETEKESSAISFEADYRGQQYYLSTLRAFQTEKNEHIKVNIPDEQNAKVGKQLIFEVLTTELIEKLYYQVISRGDIILSKQIVMEKNNLHRFSLNITHNMAPRAMMMVYYIRPENYEIIMDTISFNVDGLFRTPVSINVDKNLTEPNNKITVNIQTKAGAFVALLAVDQSVLLLKSGNDITREDIINELESYDNTRKHTNTFFRGSESSSATKLLEDANIIGLTNGILTKYYDILFYRSYSNRQIPGAIDIVDETLGKKINLNYKASSADKVGKNVRVRKYFPETWIWDNLTTNANGIASYKTIVPDTITSWIISAFAMDDFTGLGITEINPKVTVFRHFFIKLNLPYSIISGETVAIQIIVFNYFKKSLNTKVTLKNELNEFNFTIASNEIDDQFALKSKSKFVQVDAESSASVTFLITTSTIGSIQLKVIAISELASDAIEKYLNVQPEGDTQYFNKAILLNFGKNNPNTLQKINIITPHNAIKGSKRIYLSVIGDVLGTSMNNIDNLLRVPYGCGEQNMLNFILNIVVLNYLEKSGRALPGLRHKAIENIEIGYQREITYKRDDGSFSAFGNRDKTGSTWLTAFVVRSFQKAKEWITIDDDILQKAIKFLISKQSKDGSFKENGEVHHKAMQGGSSGSTAVLSAYVAIALGQIIDFKLQYPIPYSRVKKYLENTLYLSNNSYEISIITYALSLLSDQTVYNDEVEKGIEKLFNLAKKDKEYTWWAENNESDINLSNKQSAHFFFPKSTDIEATAYALLILANYRSISVSMPIMKWLISKQNSNGGFSSTQDTAIALSALAEMASKVTSSTILISASFKMNNRIETFEINEINAKTLQKKEISDINEELPEFVELKANGSGIAIAQISWQYNLAVSAEEPAFYLNPLLGKTLNDNIMQLNLCTYYTRGNTTNMAVMEVNLPSGFIADVNSLESIKNQGPGIKKVETTNDNTKVIVYFDTITKDELCITVPAHRVQKVANYKAVPVLLYDYYNRLESSRIMYYPHESRTCEICTGDECKCKGDEPRKLLSSERSSVILMIPSILTTLMLIISGQILS